MRRSIGWVGACIMVVGCGQTTRTALGDAGAGGTGESGTGGPGASGPGASGPGASGTGGSGGHETDGDSTSAAEASPCSIRVVDPQVLCAEHDPCVLTRAVEVQCPRPQSPSAVATEDGLWGAVSTSLDGATSHSSIFRVDASTLANEISTENVSAWVLSNSRDIVALDWDIGQVTVLRRQHDGNWERAESYARLEGDRDYDSLVDQDGGVHLAVWNDVTFQLSLLTRRDERRVVCEGDCRAFTLFEDNGVHAAFIRASAEQPTRGVTWDLWRQLADGTPERIAGSTTPNLPSSLKASQHGEIFSLDVPSSRVDGTERQGVVIDGAYQDTWLSGLSDAPCEAVAPGSNSRCPDPTPSRSFGAGATLGAHGVTVASDGTRWLARVAGPLGGSCEYRELRDTEGRVTSCVSSSSVTEYEPRLEVFRLPDLERPVFSAAVASDRVLREATVHLQRSGSRLGMAVRVAETSYFTRAWLLELDTTLLE